MSHILYIGLSQATESYNIISGYICVDWLVSKLLLKCIE